MEERGVQPGELLHRPLGLVGRRRTKCASLGQRPPGLGAGRGVAASHGRRDEATNARSSSQTADTSRRGAALGRRLGGRDALRRTAAVARGCRADAPPRVAGRGRRGRPPPSRDARPGIPGRGPVARRCSSDGCAPGTTGRAPRRSASTSTAPAWRSNAWSAVWSSSPTGSGGPRRSSGRAAAASSPSSWRCASPSGCAASSRSAARTSTISRSTRWSRGSSGSSPRSAAPGCRACSATTASRASAPRSSPSGWPSRSRRRSRTSRSTHAVTGWSTGAPVSTRTPTPSRWTRATWACASIRRSTSCSVAALAALAAAPPRFRGVSQR